MQRKQDAALFVASIKAVRKIMQQTIASFDFE